jgi:hypothetical protein
VLLIWTQLKNKSMKYLRNYLVFFLVCAGMMVFSSCSEDTDLISDNNDELTQDLHLTKITIGDIETFLNPVSYDIHLKAEKEEDGLKISKNLLELSIASRELFRDNAYNLILKEKAQSNINRTFDMNEIDLDLKSSNTDINKIKSILENIDLTRKVISNEKSAKTNIERYIPAIFIPNSKTADYNLKPFISPGLVVNCEAKGLEDFEDYIIAWYYDDDNNLREFLLNEEMAKKTKHPIFIFDNADKELTYTTKSESIIANNNTDEPSYIKYKSVTNRQKFSSHEYKLNHRFEGSGKSEFWLTGVWVLSDFSRYEFLKSGGTNHEITKVDKDDIGDQLYLWWPFNDWDLAPLDETHVFFNTYERDWFRSYKSFGSGTARSDETTDFKTIYLTGRAHYNSDWYTFDPDENLPRIDMEAIYSSWAKWYESDNGNIRIWRVD